ncbi:MAG: hypothetical protein LBU67_05860 [Oscillospiraceae bacterium]|nr:hypothetical protein [Oscillospiraceae bacterium]
MRKMAMLLCALVWVSLHPHALAAGAQMRLYTGQSGYTVAVPGDWVTLFGEDDEEDDGAVQPGEDEAMFMAPDGATSLVLACGEPQADARAYLENLTQEQMAAPFSAIAGFAPLGFQADPALPSAMLAFAYIEEEGDTPMVQYVVFFLAQQEVSVLTISVPQQNLDAMRPIIGGIITSIDTGEVRTGAEG